MNTGKISAALIAGMIICGCTDIYNVVSTVSAAGESGGKTAVMPELPDFNLNDVNGTVTVYIPPEIDAQLTITFDSPEGEDFLYYDILANGGTAYAFGIEGTLSDTDRIYTLSILPVSNEGYAAAEAYTEEFTVADPDTVPDSYFVRNFDVKFDYEYDGTSWELTKDDGENKELLFSFRRYAMGDVDLDGKIAASDAALVLSEYAALAANGGSVLDKNQKLVADVDSDEKITAFDAAKILEYYADASSGKTPSWE